jgi:hypothetical protein
MDVFGGKDDVKLAVLLDDVALADGAGDDSQGFFPELLASGRSGQVCPWPREAVSGRNILIWPADATLFRRRDMDKPRVFGQEGPKMGSPTRGRRFRT